MTVEGCVEILEQFPHEFHIARVDPDLEDLWMIDCTCITTCHRCKFEQVCSLPGLDNKRILTSKTVEYLKTNKLHPEWFI